MSAARAKKLIDREKKEKELKEAQAQVSEEKRKALGNVFRAYHCSMQELFDTGKVRSDMVVITDPPYPQEYLPRYGELARRCAAAKVPLVAVMCGQSYHGQRTSIGLDTAPGATVTREVVG